MLATQCISVTGGSSGLSVVLLQVCGHGQFTKTNRPSFPLQTHASIQHTHRQQIGPACDAKQQHAVALLTSPVSAHCNDSFFFSPCEMLLIRTQRAAESALRKPPKAHGGRVRAAHTCGCLRRAASERRTCEEKKRRNHSSEWRMHFAPAPLAGMWVRVVHSSALIHRDII